MDQSCFLNVAASLTGRKWVDRLDIAGARTATAIAQKTDLDEIVARIVAARGVEPGQAEAFLLPTLRDLMPDPSALFDLDAAVERLAHAIQNRERVALFGDYDVDGASAVALMVRYLEAMGLNPITHIPDRIFEGYGPNVAAINELINAGATLIVTLDCGTSSRAVLETAGKRDVDVLVIDHHLAAGELPDVRAVVNPNRSDDLSGLGYLCAAGVTFMVLVGLSRLLRDRGVLPLPDLMNMLDLVALATVCDVVPLVGLNRAFVQRGLEVIRSGTNPGILALALAARVTGPANVYHLGFLLGPRINAGGRIGDASLGAKLLASHDEHEAMAIAARLDELNAERQRIEKQAVDEAIAAAEAEIGDGDGPAVLVLASADWHQGVVGLVAARLRERFERPAFAFALGADGSGTGSGRSMPGVDLGSAVIEAVSEGVLSKGGGHAMAAGATLDLASLPRFRAFMSERLSEAVAAARQQTAIKIDAALTARGASTQFVHSIERAGPFGSGNPTPVFAFPMHKARYAQIVGQGHVRFTLASDDGARLKAIAFRTADTVVGKALLEGDGSTPLHFCGTLGIDHYQGREQVQFRLIDVARP